MCMHEVEIELERAVVWLERYEFGEQLIDQLLCDTAPNRLVRWLGLVNRIHTIMQGTRLRAYPVRLPALEEDADDQEPGIAGWPALLAKLID